MKIKLSAAVLIIFSLAACTSIVKVDQKTDSNVLKQDTETARNLLLGQWCGERFDDDGNHLRWLVNRFEDGFYEIKFI
ncbi:hypothetical protein [Sessilibacter corallicola]|uniref:hypothetical protein n=1 Tax=Sessilibacter corallicola TaxID=2904075 RepID=UPI001E51421E|nr:hypothetical protein [Sessilibacter corallicola]MCE2026765.1 hypothetical protein [Sessilibacter corallicola]